MRSKLSLYLFIPIFIGIVSSCSDTTSKVQTNETADTVTGGNMEDGRKPSKYEILVSSVPLPFDLLDKLNTSGIPYRQDVMNPVSNATKYSQFNSKAINLGIYGADLAYSVTFSQFQTMGSYIKITKKLADDLDIPMAFDQEMLDKYSKYKDNKDSLAKAVYDSYTEVDKTLKNNERTAIADLVVTGSWLEGIYLSIKMLIEDNEGNEHDELNHAVWKQKMYFEKSIALLDEFKSDPYFANLIKELTEIKAVYDDPENNTEISKKALDTLYQKTEKLRNRLIEGQ